MVIQIILVIDTKENHTIWRFYDLGRGNARILILAESLSLYCDLWIAS